MISKVEATFPLLYVQKANRLKSNYIYIFTIIILLSSGLFWFQDPSNEFYG